MKRAIGLKKWIVVCGILSATATRGDGIWTVRDCWNNRQDAPSTKLSDFGIVGFMGHTRVATLDAKLETRLSRVRTRMKFSSIPENVALRRVEIPGTLAEAAVYLNHNVCMAYPPVLCVETDDAFFFSGGTSTEPVYDFGSGIAIMKADGSIWTWDGEREDSTGLTETTGSFPVTAAPKQP